MTMRNDDGRRTVRNDGFGWGIPAAIAAVALIIGGLFFFNSSDRTTTASNNRPAVTGTTGTGTTGTGTTGPAGSQAPANPTVTTPAPATTPLKQ